MPLSSDIMRPFVYGSWQGRNQVHTYGVINSDSLKSSLICTNKTACFPGRDCILACVLRLPSSLKGRSVPICSLFPHCFWKLCPLRGLLVCSTVWLNLTLSQKKKKKKVNWVASVWLFARILFSWTLYLFNCSIQHEWVPSYHIPNTEDTEIKSRSLPSETYQKYTWISALWAEKSLKFYEVRPLLFNS